MVYFSDDVGPLFFLPSNDHPDGDRDDDAEKGEEDVDEGDGGGLVGPAAGVDEEVEGHHPDTDQSGQTRH